MLKWNLFFTLVVKRMIICVHHSLEFYSIYIFLFNNLTIAIIKIRDLNFDYPDKRKNRKIMLLSYKVFRSFIFSLLFSFYEIQICTLSIANGGLCKFSI